ncbi:hypothetical protein LK540_15635 [Massilia sp. IC2-278]|uniref:hypothetical protein n=1 Tax=Massilia sp. IC2-278 TaxID=2887200 RepID=UPI001E363A38|nr:hypothetical protein [Massilia sp. IC2-278]MCC2961862.1 hypothetical protein [Massilia sp. IC2-278]
MRKNKLVVAFILAATLLAGCNPTYNWRDYSSPDAPYRVMFPTKPASHTRSVDLDGVKVEMTMTAAEVEGVMFAVGTGVAEDAAGAQAAVDAMKTAMLRNIGATVQRESASAASNGDPASAHKSIDLEATGAGNGGPMQLTGHFESRGKRFYQVIVLGKEKAVPAEQSEQFMKSFTLL